MQESPTASDRHLYLEFQVMNKDNDENVNKIDHCNDAVEDDVQLEIYPNEDVDTGTGDRAENNARNFNETAVDKLEDSSQSLEFSNVIVTEAKSSSQTRFTLLNEMNTGSSFQDQLELEEEAIILDNILIKEKQDNDSDSEFDFELLTAAPAKPSENEDTVSKQTEVDINKKEEQRSVGKQEESLSETTQAVTTLKPLAFVKPTPQALGFSYPVEKMEPEPEKQKMLKAAQDEWEKVTTIQPGCMDAGTRGGSEPALVQTMPSISPFELKETLMQGDFRSVRANIKPSVERRGFAAFVNLLFGPPKLTRNLLEERDKVFCIAASQLENGNSSHVRTLQTIYKCLTGSKFDCPRMGNHWEEVGFQGSDPATDLRGAGLLGLLNLLHFLKDPKKQTLASDIYRLSLHPTQNFPFCVMGINLTKITLQTLREEVLNKECNRCGDIISVVNEFYVGLYLQLYLVWKGQGKTISDSGYVIKDLELKAKKNPKWILKSLEDYLNKKTTIATEKGPGVDGDDFVNVCD